MTYNDKTFTVNTEPEVSLLHMPSSVIVCLERVEW